VARLPPEIENLKPTDIMKTALNELIAELVQSAILCDTETDTETGAAWKNGTVTTPDGDMVDMGGGWIENEESANQKNEEAGIAGGLRQGVSYPNETVAGSFSAYGYGEDESGWQKEIMPLVLGEDWENADEADEAARQIFDAVQAEMARLANED